MIAQAVWKRRPAREFGGTSMPNPGIAALAAPTVVIMVGTSETSDKPPIPQLSLRDPACPATFE